MAISTETTFNSAAPAFAILRKYLTASVHIAAPTNNAKRSSSFTITGGASCQALQDETGEGGVITVNLGNVPESITAVDVHLGDTNPFQSATPTGSGTAPWTTWSFAANTMVPGPLTITARVSAAKAGFEGDTDTAVIQVTINLTPPTLTVNPPANITKATPPYTATLTGAATADVAGVAAVEWRLGSSGSFQAATGTTDWAATVALPGLGAYTVTVRARDHAGNFSTAQNVTVNVVDTTPPALSITTSPGGRDLYAGWERRDRRGQRHRVGYLDRRRPG
jgi:hypothetical protein